MRATQTVLIALCPLNTHCTSARKRCCVLRTHCLWSCSTSGTFRSRGLLRRSKGVGTAVSGSGLCGTLEPGQVDRWVANRVIRIKATPNCNYLQARYPPSSQHLGWFQASV